MPMVLPPTEGRDWLSAVLFERGFLAKLKGEAIKVYLVMVEDSGGKSDASITLSLSEIMHRTKLSCPTVIDALARLEMLGLVVSTNRRRGRTTTYYIPNPLKTPPSSGL